MDGKDSVGRAILHLPFDVTKNQPCDLIFSMNQQAYRWSSVRDLEQFTKLLWLWKLVGWISVKWGYELLICYNKYKVIIRKVKLFF